MSIFRSDLVFVVAYEALYRGDVFGGGIGEFEAQGAASWLHRHDVERGGPHHHRIDRDDGAREADRGFDFGAFRKKRGGSSGHALFMQIEGFARKFGDTDALHGNRKFNGDAFKSAAFLRVFGIQNHE